MSQISISYNDPKTGEKLTRDYKIGIDETEPMAFLAIIRALDFVYQQPIKFHINERETD